MATEAQTSEAASTYMQTYFPEVLAADDQHIADVVAANNLDNPPNYSFDPPALSNIQTLESRVVNIPANTKEMIYGPDSE